MSRCDATQALSLGATQRLALPGNGYGSSAQINKSRATILVQDKGSRLKHEHDERGGTGDRKREEPVQKDGFEEHRLQGKLSAVHERELGIFASHVNMTGEPSQPLSERWSTSTSYLVQCLPGPGGWSHCLGVLLSGVSGHTTCLPSVSTLFTVLV